MMRITLCTLVLVFTTTLAMAAGSIIDGRPGQIEFKSAYIDLTDNSCLARYDVTVNGNSVISTAGQGTGDIKVTENKNMIKARCQFTDISGKYEANAEVGYINDCELITAEGSLFGSGRVTAAANNVVEGEATDNGGNVTIQCTFDPEQPL